MSREIKIRVGRWQITYTPGGQYADIGHAEEYYTACDCLNYRWNDETHEPSRKELRTDLLEWIEDHGTEYEREILFVKS